MVVAKSIVMQSDFCFDLTSPAVIVKIPNISRYKVLVFKKKNTSHGEFRNGSDCVTMQQKFFLSFVFMLHILILIRSKSKVRVQMSVKKKNCNFGTK